MLDNQVAQQAVALKQMGKLPSQPDVNSIEHVEAITLKSGKVLPTPQGKSSPNDKEVEGGVAKESLGDEPQTPTEEEKKGRRANSNEEVRANGSFPSKVKQKQARRSLSKIC
ncbi:unnamed protein product [Rhodiola kirilowii]